MQHWKKGDGGYFWAKGAVSDGLWLSAFQGNVLSCRNEERSCGLTVVRVGVWESERPLFIRCPLAQFLGSDIYLQSSKYKAVDPMELAGGGSAGIKDPLLVEDLFLANCENRHVLTGIAGKEGSQVGKGPTLVPCPHPHPLQEPCRVPHPGHVSILSFLCPRNSNSSRTSS